jgi:hypothetical protein
MMVGSIVEFINEKTPDILVVFKNFNSFKQ